jgi:large subunit ribosomal protein L21
VYAVIQTGGKQYSVSVGDVLDVEKLPAQVGEKVELGDVLLVADGPRVTVGRPTVPGAKVFATVIDHTKGKKLVVFKYKPKIHYRRKTGHRQRCTRIRVEEIVV